MKGKKLKFDSTSLTEEEIKDFQDGCESEGCYHGTNPEVIAEIQEEMMKDNDFIDFLKSIEKQADK